MNLKPKNIFSLKYLLKKSNAYYEKDKIRIDRLLDYLGWYIIFLVKNDKFIQATVVQEME